MRCLFQSTFLLKDLTRNTDQNFQKCLTASRILFSFLLSPLNAFVGGLFCWWLLLIEQKLGNGQAYPSPFLLIFWLLVWYPFGLLHPRITKVISCILLFIYYHILSLLQDLYMLIFVTKVVFWKMNPTPPATVRAILLFKSRRIRSAYFYVTSVCLSPHFRRLFSGSLKRMGKQINVFLLRIFSPTSTATFHHRRPSSSHKTVVSYVSKRSKPIIVVAAAAAPHCLVEGQKGDLSHSWQNCHCSSRHR